MREHDVIELAHNLYSMSLSKYWLMDVFNRPMIDTMHGAWVHAERAEEKGDVGIQFIPEDTAVFLKSLGWSLRNFHSFGL